MPIVALMFVFLIGMAMLAVDGSLNYLDRRVLRAASDAGALSGAGVVSEGRPTAQNTAMSYTFLNLGLTLPADAAHTCTGDSSNPGGLGANTCLITFGGYTVTVKNDYTPLNPNANPFPAISNVSVDIFHQKPQSGFAAFSGVTTVAVGSHSAATVQNGSQSFPFALATRYLNIQGTGHVASIGAAIIGECSAEGTGGFSLNNHNGGIFFNGNTEFDLGSSVDSSGGPTLYQSAQALLMADGSTRATCTGGTPNLNPNSGWANMSDKVFFDPTDATEYNWFFGFNSGPAGCNLSTSTAAPCEANGVGDSKWMDNPCWTTAKASDVSLTTATYDARTGLTTPASPTTTACIPGAGKTHEGSFPDSRWFGFPVFPTPTSVIAKNDSGNAIPSGTAGATTLSSGGQITPDQVFTAYSAGSGADLYFQPGWYVFDGPAASVALTSGGGASFNCVNSPATGFLAGGCVFVFRNGASLTMQGSKTHMRCSPAATGGNPAPAGGYMGCAFEFHDQTVSPFNKATLKLTNNIASVDLTPVTYIPAGGPPPPPGVKLPIVWTDDNQDCTGGSTPCAVNLQQAGTFNVGGTIYIPRGIYGEGSNASGSSGQVVADTMLLQAGTSAIGSGVTYQGSVIAPIAGFPFLFE